MDLEHVAADLAHDAPRAVEESVTDVQVPCELDDCATRRPLDNGSGKLLRLPHHTEQAVEKYSARACQRHDAFAFEPAKIQNTRTHASHRVKRHEQQHESIVNSNKRAGIKAGRRHAVSTAAGRRAPGEGRLRGTLGRAQRRWP